LCNREFVNTNYLAIKTANPKFPLLVREATGVEPKVVARFGTVLPSLFANF